MAAIDDFLSARDFLLRHRTDRATAVRDFRWPVLEQFNWALDYFDRVAAGNERPALHIVNDDGSEFVASFATMSRRSHQVASFLRSQGIGRGDPILLMLGNVPALWEVMLAAIKLGAILIPSTTLLTRDDLLDRLARGHVKLVIAATEETAKFADLPGTFGRIVVGADVAGWTSYRAADQASADFRPDGPTPASQPLLLYFTSGTTAKAKLVMHTHQSYPVGHLATIYWLGLQPGDVHLNISSPGWAKHAWSCFFAPWIAEATVFVHAFKRFNAKATLDVVARHGITSLCAPPTVWRILVQEDLSSWRTRLTNLIGAGEPLNPEIIDEVKAAWGITIRDGYGQTETTLLVGNTPGMTVKPGSMGQGMPGYRVALLNLDGKEADEGEVCLALDPRPLGLMPGYADDPERTAEAMEGGYYRTGDVARRDADGYLTFIGRSDDVFKASDYRISPFELESALIEHDAVAEAAVVPSPDPLRLAAPKAFVALTAGHPPTRDTALAIFAHVRQHLAPFKRVRRLEFAELPKTISGKIRRVELRKLEAERRGAKSYDPARRYPQEYWDEDFPELRSGTGAGAG
jgi:acetyl-CoA synthetase